MNIKFLSTVAVITPDPPPAESCISTRSVYRSAVMSISTASRSPAASRSGSGRCHTPLKRASGPRNGQPTGRHRRPVSSSTLPAPQQSARRPANSSKRATSCCTHHARSRGVKQWPGCSRRRAQSSVSRISRRSTTELGSGPALRAPRASPSYGVDERCPIGEPMPWWRATGCRRMGAVV
jgi:hypothetical protein